MKPGALPTFDPETGDLNVVIETPKGSRAKFSYDDETGLFTLSKLLPAGMAFTFNFGFIPSTRGGVGDPLDVLLVFDELLFPGCLLQARLIGALKALQGEKGKMNRNDRLFAVPVLPQEYSPPGSIRDLDKRLLCEIQEFFVSYQELRGKAVKVLGVVGPKEAEKLVRQSQK